MLQVDLLHPLSITSLEWYNCKELPLGMKEAQAVWFKGKVYVGGETATKKPWDSATLYVYTSGASVWNCVDTPVHDFALTAYCSKIVLVGGRKYMQCAQEENGIITNILWTSDSEPNELSSWQENGLPPMKIKRCGASAVSSEDCPNILVVAGGNVSSSDVEVFDGSQWWMVNQPTGFHGTKSLTLFDGYLYLMSGISTWYASLDYLETRHHNDKIRLEWRKLTDIPQHLPRSWSLAVFGKRLIVTNGATIYAYSSITRCWVHIGDAADDLHIDIFSTCAIGLPNGDLMILGGESEMGSKTVVQVTCNVNGMYKTIFSLPR